MALSETMDHSYNQLGELSRQKREIEEMWVAEKNKWRLAEKVSETQYRHSAHCMLGCALAEQVGVGM